MMDNQAMANTVGQGKQPTGTPTAQTKTQEETSRGTRVLRGQSYASRHVVNKSRLMSLSKQDYKRKVSCFEMSISTVNVNVFCVKKECRLEALPIRRTRGCWYVKRVCVCGGGASMPFFYSRVNGTGERHPSASCFFSGPLSGH